MDLKYLVLGLLFCIASVKTEETDACNITVTEATYDDCCSIDGCAICKDPTTNDTVCINATLIGDTESGYNCTSNGCTADAGTCENIDVSNETKYDDCCSADGCGLCKDPDTNVTVCVNATYIGEIGSGYNCPSDGCSVEASTLGSSTLPGTSQSVTTDNTTENAGTSPTPQTTLNTTEQQTTPESSTEPMTPTDAEPACDQGQHFDPASFIGGIVLCGGLIAITFFGCKFYKGRVETKYQQF